VRKAFAQISSLMLAQDCPPVCRTVAQEITRTLAPQARVECAAGAIERADQPGTLVVAVVGEETASPHRLFKRQPPSDRPWAYFELHPDGHGWLVASRTHLLYWLWGSVSDLWIDEPIAKCQAGRLLTSTVGWVEGIDSSFACRAEQARGYDQETAVREFARMGCSHVSVNGLAGPFAYEEGPPDEIYYRFYLYSPDLDQYVATDLNKGVYPPEYLRANLDNLRHNAALAVKYGLTPGLTCCSPRSVPDALLERYPYLRGARVDHGFRSCRPRYTLTLAHPVVRWHYAQLMTNLLREVPQLGFACLWSNDSGSGFEHTATLYPGRNGGAYLIREWRDHQEIARIAAKNVLGYYRLLRDAACKINPQFRVMTAVTWFSAQEQEVIVEGMGDRVDLVIGPGELADSGLGARKRSLADRGAVVGANLPLTTNYVLGVPSPWQTARRLLALTAADLDRLQAVVSPAPLAPRDVNREVLRSFQGADERFDVDAVVAQTARRWVGAERAKALIEAWKLIDAAVGEFPEVPLYGNMWSYAWYRLWVRPMVPDIERIPKQERAYYEDYMIATANNPTLIDLRADVLWDLIPLDLADRLVAQADQAAWKRLDQAIQLLRQTAETTTEPSARAVFDDQLIRARGLWCYWRTLRNTAAWVAGVHGYLEARDEPTKARRRSQARATVLDEIENTEALLNLWNAGQTSFMPVLACGEAYYMYGENFGELLQRKLALMRTHVDDEPRIDPNFLWRMPAGCPVSPDEYLPYLKAPDA
jgi:hypothetical protein